MDTYLDYNATAPLRPQVAEAMTAALGLCGNPSSVHRFGRLARRAVEDAREAIAAALDADGADITFTSGGTEANNLALRASARPALISAVEHESVRAARGDARTIGVDANGIVDLDQLEQALSNSATPALVSVMLANNETGVIQPVGEVVALARRFGALVHCDAVQALGKMPLSIAALGVDLMSLSAHKLGGPAGAGALIAADGVALEPLLRGGGQERGRRAGTENIVGICGFGAAAKLVPAALAQVPQVAALRDDLEARALEQVPDAVIYGAGAARLPNTSCLGLPGVGNEVQLMALDLAGVAVSAGAACSSGKVSPSHVLQAMGADQAAAASAIRVSLGWRSTVADCARFVAAWAELADGRARAPSAVRSVA